MKKLFLIGILAVAQFNTAFAAMYRMDEITCRCLEEENIGHDIGSAEFYIDPRDNLTHDAIRKLGMRECKLKFGEGATLDYCVKL